jgi:shikimate dehydrogenase
MPLLDEVDETAAAIGAVNVIKFQSGKLIGYNSDAYGFELPLRAMSAKKQTEPTHNQALVLGTGGASLAVCYVLKKLGIAFKKVSRTPKEGLLTYPDIDADCLKNHQLIINCTPLGTYPKENTFPDLPYEAVTSNHFFYDLVYNPAETLFMKKAKAHGAATMNGLAMLHLQAERAWVIWNG